MFDLRPDQIEALERISKLAELEKADRFDKKTELLDDLLEENKLVEEIYKEIHPIADQLKEKYNMTISDGETLDNLLFEVNSNTLKAITSLKNVLIFRQ